MSTPAPRRAPALDGMLPIDKPEGLSSFDVVRAVKRLVHPRKTGHTGTLDPMATGLLLVCVGEATKLVRFLSSQQKRYRARIKLGVATDTYDRHGQVIATAPIPALTEAAIQGCLQGFLGEIDQVPPMYSALHHEGVRLYELARQGVEVERKPRKVLIHELTLGDRGEDFLEIDVLCGEGTYVRSLAGDIAERLGTLGHLTLLERTETAGFDLKDALPLDQLTPETLERRLLPLEVALAPYPRHDVSEAQAERLRQGQRLPSSELQALGAADHPSGTIVWFRPPAGTPLVVAQLQQIEAPAPATTMTILRVLNPTRPGSVSPAAPRGPHGTRA